MCDIIILEIKRKKDNTMQSVIHYSKSLRYKTYIRNLEIYELRISLLSRVTSRVNVSTKLRIRAITTQELSGCYTATVKKSIVLKMKNVSKEIPINEET